MQYQYVQIASASIANSLRLGGYSLENISLNHDNAVLTGLFLREQVFLETVSVIRHLQREVRPL